MKLIVDAGNTKTKLALFEGEEMKELVIADSLTREMVDSIQMNVKIRSVIISSVGQLSFSVFDSIKKDVEIYLILNSKTPVPLVNQYQTPESLGMDRLATAVAAKKFFPDDPVLVIDAGSAITYDFITSEGCFLGGNISPGMDMRIKALNHFTSNIPLVEAAWPGNDMGRNTTEAIQAGVAWGIVHEINGYIHRLSEEKDQLKIILTGGDAFFFDKKLKNSIFVHPDLLVRGLNAILDYNAQI